MICNAFKPPNFLVLAGIFLGGILLALLFAGLGYYYFVEPAEDALILFCFSENLADTGVISYYPGGPRAEGATDFLWMIALSLLYKAGIPSFFAAHLLSGFGLVTIAMYLRKIYRFVRGVEMPLLEFALVFLLLLFQKYTLAAILGFSVWFFGAFIAATLYYFIKRRLVRFAVWALLLCLVRPDGVFLALPLSVFLLFEKRRGFYPTLKPLLFYAVLPGTVYFLVRYFYFGKLLPLPFYVKSSMEYSTIFENLFEMFKYYDYVFPLVILFGVSRAFQKHISYKIKTTYMTRTYGILIALCFIVLAYTNFRLEQNVADRFFVLLGIPIIAFYTSFKVGRWLWLSFMISMVFICGKSFYSSWYGWEMKSYKGGDVRHPLGKALSKVTPKGKLFCASAGALAYYSKWEVYDFWGLATQEFSEQIALPQSVTRHKPDIIVVASCESAIDDVSAPDCLDVSQIQVKKARSFENMECNIHKGTVGLDYERFKIGKETQRAYVVYLREESPLYSQILSELKAAYSPQEFMSYCEYVRRRSND